MSGIIQPKKDERSRHSLRLEPDVLSTIDVSRESRTGFVSRNTWILEAILEKLSREKKERTEQEGSNVHFL